MRVLVTGGSGFVGGRLIRRLAELGIEVRATHRRDDVTPVAGVEWWPLKAINDERRLAESVTGCAAVIHLAGLAHRTGSAESLNAEFRRINVEGTRMLARSAALAGVRKFIFMSSIAAVCTRSETPVDDVTQCAPTDAYGRSKLEAEHALVLQLKECSTDWCILRPPLVYGPGNPGNMRRLIRVVSSGLPLPFASIRNLRSFIFVDNLVDATIRILRHEGAVRATYVISDGSDFSTPQFASALAEAAGYRLRMLTIPVSALIVLGRAGDSLSAILGRSFGLNSTTIDRLVGSLPIDGSRFRQYFDWHPPIGVDVALSRMAQAFSAT